MKSFAILGSLTTTVVALSGAAFASAPITTPIAETQITESYLIDRVIPGTKLTPTLLEETHQLAQTQAEIDARAEERSEQVNLQYEQMLLDNQLMLEDTLSRVIARVDKTRYVFSGSTPEGWDCSGLVMWAYAEMGIELPHSASKQGTMGIKVKEPVPGDVVLFAKGGSIFHSALYVGDNKVVHAGFKPGTKTEIISLDSPSFAGTKITFRRLLELPVVN